MEVANVNSKDVLKNLEIKLQQLPDDQIDTVVEFVDFLQKKYEPTSEMGSPEAILRHAGGWSFEGDELENLLTEIQEIRDMDLKR